MRTRAVAWFRRLLGAGEAGPRRPALAGPLRATEPGLPGSRRRGPGPPPARRDHVPQSSTEEETHSVFRRAEIRIPSLMARVFTNYSIS